MPVALGLRDIICSIAVAHSISWSVPPGQVMKAVLPSMSMLSIEHPSREVTTDTTWRKFRSSCNIFSAPFPHVLAKYSLKVPAASNVPRIDIFWEPMSKLPFTYKICELLGGRQLGCS